MFSDRVDAVHSCVANATNHATPSCQRAPGQLKTFVLDFSLMDFQETKEFVQL